LRDTGNADRRRESPDTATLIQTAPDEVGQHLGSTPAAHGLVSIIAGSPGSVRTPTEAVF